MREDVSVPAWLHGLTEYSLSSVNETSPTRGKCRVESGIFCCESEGNARLQKHILLFELAFELLIPCVHAVGEGVVARFHIAHGDIAIAGAESELFADLGLQPHADAVGEMVLAVTGKTPGFVGLVALGVNPRHPHPGHSIKRQPIIDRDVLV